MPPTRSDVEATKAFIRARLGNPYVYGGALSLNVKQGTDCSEVWQTVLEMAFGRWRQGRQSEGATTESYRYIPVGGVGPFGTIRVANWRDIPANAAAKLAFHHGPGGGANSHMWGELDGMRIESGGSKGLVTGDRAMTIDSSYANAWAYLPGPIDGVSGPVTLGIGSTGPEVVALQQRLNTEGAGLEVDGDYGPATAAAVTAWDRRTGYAKTVRDEGVRRGVTPRGIQIAFSVVFVESGWKNYANSKVPESMGIPHDAVGTDYDSVGLFQQRCPMWGPADVLMNPALSAGLFYDRLVKMDYNDGSRSPGSFAADVQRPAAQYRYRYDERFGDAVALFNRLSGAQPIEEGFLMALSDSEQREVLESARRQSRPRPSKSPLRPPGEGDIGDMYDVVGYIDGSVHWLAVKSAAELGHPKYLDLLKRVAADPSRPDDSELAQAILADIEAKRNAPVQAVAEAYKAPPQIVYVDRVVDAPQPAATLAALEPNSGGSTGQIIGRAYDALEELRLADALPIENRAPLAALIAVLQTKNGSAI